MDEKLVRKLEQDFAKAIFAALQQPRLGTLPLLPSERTVHFMAKAAVAVYEAAVESARTTIDPRSSD